MKKDFFGLKKNIILGYGYCAPNSSLQLVRQDIDPDDDLEQKLNDLANEGDFLFMADMNAQNTTRKEYIETEDESIIPELAPISDLYL